MKTFLLGSVLAATLAAAAPAHAQDWRYDRGYHGDYDRGYSDRGYYGRGDRDDWRWRDRDDRGGYYGDRRADWRFRRFADLNRDGFVSRWEYRRAVERLRWERGW